MKIFRIKACDCPNCGIELSFAKSQNPFKLPETKYGEPCTYICPNCKTDVMEAVYGPTKKEKTEAK